MRAGLSQRIEVWNQAAKATLGSAVAQSMDALTAERRVAVEQEVIHREGMLYDESLASRVRT